MLVCNSFTSLHLYVSNLNAISSNAFVRILVYVYIGCDEAYRKGDNSIIMHKAYKLSLVALDLHTDHYIVI